MPWYPTSSRRAPTGLVLSLVIMLAHAPSFGNDLTPTYVGPEVCRGCHRREYANFMKYANKARSFESIERMKRDLTAEEIRKCYSCHTTGYGRRGGFESPEKTPHLQNAGCEACHGPGSIHARTKQGRDIKGKLTMRDCAVCHVEERIKAYKYKPMIHVGSH